MPFAMRRFNLQANAIHGNIDAGRQNASRECCPECRICGDSGCEDRCKNGTRSSANSAFLNGIPCLTANISIDNNRGYMSCVPMLSMKVDDPNLGYSFGAAQFNLL